MFNENNGSDFVPLDTSHCAGHAEETFHSTTLTNPSVLFIPQASIPLAELITEVAKTCACPHLMDGPTAVAVETGNY